MGLLHYFIKPEVRKDGYRIFISQVKYARKLFKKIGVTHYTTLETHINVDEKLSLKMENEELT